MVLNTPIADTANSFASPTLPMQIDNVEAPAPAPLAVGILTERVQDAMDFVKARKVRFDAEHLSINHIVAHSIKLHECSSIVTEFLEAVAEKLKSDKSIITAKTMFGLKGSAT